MPDPLWQKTMTFADKVYSACKRIPRGKVSTYKEIAKSLHTRAYRAVGQALSVNPYAPVVPCHRVVASDGTLGGFSGKTSGAAIRKKIGLLSKEGVKAKAGRILDFENKLFRF
jgi:methylated-DNA-[protein]-cysteine S-methyltransferase